jgi:hypothetical protein
MIAALRRSASRENHRRRRKHADNQKAQRDVIKVHGVVPMRTSCTPSFGPARQARCDGHHGKTFLADGGVIRQSRRFSHRRRLCFRPQSPRFLGGSRWVSKWRAGVPLPARTLSPTRKAYASHFGAQTIFCGLCALRDSKIRRPNQLRNLFNSSPWPICATSVPISVTKSDYAAQNNEMCFLDNAR